jgi:hypothetical protein
VTIETEEGGTDELPDDRSPGKNRPFAEVSRKDSPSPDANDSSKKRQGKGNTSKAPGFGQGA